MTRELNHTGAFIVYELHSKRIIKLHNHYNTAIKHVRKLGTERTAIKPVADRIYYEVGGFV
jgi:hypothetical protein